MARRKAKDKRSFAAIVLVVICAIAAIFSLTDENGFDSMPTTAVKSDYVSSATDEIKVHILDVGNASCSLIQCGDTGILIDGGEKSTGADVVSYLQKAGIKKLKYVIASHPHSDHIGGLVEVFEKIETENVIMPQLTEENMPTTMIYEDFLNAIMQNNINAYAANYGDSYSYGDVTLKILGPIKQDNELNNMSVICKATVFKTDIIFPADAENKALNNMLAKDPNIDSEILVVAHHGSKTSLNENFLGKVSPNIAVISCGKNNKYGHPDKEVTDALEKRKIEYYRTDTAGNIIFTCTPKGYNVKSVY